MKPYLASLLILLLLAGCSPSAPPEDTASPSETENTAPAGDPEDPPLEEFVISPTDPDPAPEEAPSALVLYTETPMQVADDGPSFLIQAFYRDGEEEYITDLRIIKADTSELFHEASLTFQTKYLSEPEAVHRDLFDITFDDVDFDGYQDIIVHLGYTKFWHERRFYFVWDDQAGQFKENPYGLQGIGVSRFDQETQTIHFISTTYYADFLWMQHQYIDGELTLIDRLSDNAICYRQVDSPIRQQVQALEPLYDRDIHFFSHFFQYQLNRDTMEMELVENKFRLKAIDDKCIALAEYDFDSELGILFREQYSSDWIFRLY